MRGSAPRRTGARRLAPPTRAPPSPSAPQAFSAAQARSPVSGDSLLGNRSIMQQLIYYHVRGGPACFFAAGGGGFGLDPRRLGDLNRARVNMGRGGGLRSLRIPARPPQQPTSPALPVPPPNPTDRQGGGGRAPPPGQGAAHDDLWPQPHGRRHDRQGHWVDGEDRGGKHQGGGGAAAGALRAGRTPPVPARCHLPSGLLPATGNQSGAYKSPGLPAVPQPFRP